MLTESPSTSVVSNKIKPVAYSAHASDQFGAVTGQAGLIATEFSYRKDEEIYGEDELANYVYQLVRFAVTSGFPMDGVRSAHSICQAMFSAWNPERSTGLQRKPLSIRQCAS